MDQVDNNSGRSQFKILKNTISGGTVYTYINIICIVEFVSLQRHGLLGYVNFTNFISY
jgi:hypothetical protein